MNTELTTLKIAFLESPSRRDLSARLVELAAAVPRFAPARYDQPSKKFDPEHFEISNQMYRLGWSWWPRHRGSDGSIGPLAGNDEYSVGVHTNQPKMVDPDLISMLCRLSKWPNVTFGAIYHASTSEFEWGHSFGLSHRAAEGMFISGDSASWISLGIRYLGWANVFGPMFIRLIGKDRLLSAPAHRVQEIAPDTILLLLSPDRSEVISSWSQFHTRRTQVMEHIGTQYFSTLIHETDQRAWIGNRGFRQPCDPVAKEFVPRELWKIRDRSDINLRKMADRAEAERREAVARDAQLPPPLMSLQEMLSSPLDRLEIVTLDNGSKVIVDAVRRELIDFAEPDLVKQWIQQLLARGFPERSTA